MNYKLKTIRGSEIENNDSTIISDIIQVLSASLNCYIVSNIPASLSFCFIEQLPLTYMDFTSMNYLHVNVSVWLQWLKSEMFLMDCHLIR